MSLLRQLLQNRSSISKFVRQRSLTIRQFSTNESPTPPTTTTEANRSDGLHGKSLMEPKFKSSDDRPMAAKNESSPPPSSSIETTGPAGNVDFMVEERRQDPPFATMLRKSKLMQIGDANGRVLIARIVYATDDDLYIDFGGKFWAVCKRPRKDGDLYRRNSLVIIRLHDLELSSRFLAASSDLTLLEADAILLGLARRTDPSANRGTESSTGGGGGRRRGKMMQQ